MDPVKHNGLAVHKAAAEFFDSVGTVRNSVDEGKGKGIPLFPDCGEKIGDIQFKADTVLRLGAVSENLVVKGARSQVVKSMSSIMVFLLLF